MEYAVDPLLHLESHEVFAGNNSLDPTLGKKNESLYLSVEGFNSTVLIVTGNNEINK